MSYVKMCTIRMTGRIDKINIFQMMKIYPLQLSYHISKYDMIMCYMTSYDFYITEHALKRVRIVSICMDYCNATTSIAIYHSQVLQNAKYFAAALFCDLPTADIFCE